MSEPKILKGKVIRFTIEMPPRWFEENVKTVKAPEEAEVGLHVDWEVANKLLEEEEFKL